MRVHFLYLRRQATLNDKKMDQLPQQFTEMMGWLMPLIIVLSVWSVIWKMIAMWKSARNNDLAWFIVIAIVNTIGILPIIYILLNKKKSREEA